MMRNRSDGDRVRLRRPAARSAASALAFAAIAALTIGSPRSGRTQQGAELAVASAFVGTYRNAAPDGGRGAVEAATDAALADARPLVRAIARPRILDTNPPFERVTIALEGNDLEIAFDDDRSYRAPLGGPPVALRAPDGSAMDLSYRVEGGALVAIAAARRGASRTTYVLDEDGLKVTTVIESDRLPAPIRFAMRLRRR